HTQVIAQKVKRSRMGYGIMSERTIETIKKIGNWQRSVNGHDIALYHSQRFNFTDSPAPLLWLGGVHGDEPEGVHLCHLLLNYLETNPENINNRVPWIMIPCLNPEGIETGVRTNGNGVDLNRNFPSLDWSPEHSKPR